MALKCGSLIFQEAGGGTSDAMERIWSQTCPGVFIITGDRKLEIIASGSLDLVRTLDYCSFRCSDSPTVDFELITNVQEVQGNPWCLFVLVHALLILGLKYTYLCNLSWRFILGLHYVSGTEFINQNIKIVV